MRFIFLLALGFLPLLACAAPVKVSVYGGVGCLIYNGVPGPTPAAPGSYGWYRFDVKGQLLPIPYTIGTKKASCLAWFNAAPTKTSPYGSHICCSSLTQMNALLTVNAQAHVLISTP